MNVYIIKNEDNYKIGKANDVNKRLKALQTGSPSKHELIAVVSTSNAIELEHNIHAYLSAYRISGEWFKLDNKTLYYTIDKFGFNEIINFIDKLHLHPLCAFQTASHVCCFLSVFRSDISSFLL